MRLKKRILYGIDIINSISGVEKIPYINFGEGKFAYLSWEDFCLKLLPTAKIKKGSKVEPLKKHIHDFEFQGVSSFLKNYFENFVDLKDKVVIFKNMSYRIEDNIWVKHCDGVMQYFVVAHHKGFKIKFNRNGINGYSIWKNRVCLEDNIWSISKAKEIIGRLS